MPPSNTHFEANWIERAELLSCKYAGARDGLAGAGFHSHVSPEHIDSLTRLANETGDS
jgi:hypothetical protein